MSVADLNSTNTIPQDDAPLTPLRLQPIKALKALAELLKNKEDTGQVFIIMRALSGRSTAKGYAKLLQAYGRPQRGEPRMMALYQDLVHAIRGPKHAAALFAEYDDTRCVVRRRQCIYFDETNPHNGRYTEAFEAGCFDGYVAADDNLLRVEVIRCRFQGTDGCEQHWVFKPPAERLPPA